MSLLNSPAARVLAGVLLLQAAAFYAVASRAEATPPVAPLNSFANGIGEWSKTREFPLEKEEADVLRADDTTNRIYANPQGTEASLFIAFFKTQRYGQSPHSPKNCLPGAGWQYNQDRKLPIAVPGLAEPIRVNEYVIARGDEESVVLYWYHSHKRVIAGELAAKIWLVADAVRYRRSDTALVRVIVPVRDGAREAAERSAIEFVQASFPYVTRQFPD
jgi:EpsI family protein